MRKVFLVVCSALLAVCLVLAGCAMTSVGAGDATLNLMNAEGKLTAYEGKQQESDVAFVNAVNVDNEYIFYYFYLGTVSKVPVYTSETLLYSYDTAVELTFNSLTSESLSNSIAETVAVVENRSSTLGIGTKLEGTISGEMGVAFAKVKTSITAAAETDRQWTNSWGATETNSREATASYLTQYSMGFKETVSFSEEAGFTKGNYYRMSFYDSVGAYGVLGYDLSEDTYYAANDFILNKNSRVRVWEESETESFHYQYNKDIVFDMEAAVDYVETHRAEIFPESEETGTSAVSPYLISNVDDFMDKITKNDGGNKYFRLVKDIDFARETVVPYDGFYGNLDGAGHTIRNVVLEVNSVENLIPTDADAYYVGLFQFIYGTISNVNVENIEVNVSGLNKRARVGTLGGGLLNGTLFNCRAEGEITVSNGGTVNTLWAGGLVGYAENARISYCGADVAVTVTNENIINCGGLVGRVCGSSISASYSNGDVEANGSAISADNAYIDIGGLVGRVIKNEDLDYKSEIMNCFATGKVYCDAEKGSVYAGGFIGRLYDGDVIYIYATGQTTAKNRTGNAYAGGLIALANDSKINNAFSTSSVYAHGNYQGEEKQHSFYGHILASEKNLSLWKLYFDKNADFKENGAGIELTWDTDYYTGVSLTTILSDKFQREEMELNETVWEFINGSYPVLR